MTCTECDPAADRYAPLCPDCRFHRGLLAHAARGRTPVARELALDLVDCGLLDARAVPSDAEWLADHGVEVAS